MPPFAIDTQAVQQKGQQIAYSADSDLYALSGQQTLTDFAPVPSLVGSLTVDPSYMPSMLVGPLTQFSQNFKTAISQVFGQRHDIGQTLQGVALAGELNEIKTASSFRGPTSQGGLLPGAPG